MHKIPLCWFLIKNVEPIFLMTDHKKTLTNLLTIQVKSYREGEINFVRVLYIIAF